MDAILRKNRRKLDLLDQYEQEGRNDGDSHGGNLHSKYAQYLNSDIIGDGPEAEFVAHLQEINSRPSTGYSALNSARYSCVVRLLHFWLFSSCCFFFFYLFV